MLRGVDISSLRPKYAEGAFSAGCVFGWGATGELCSTAGGSENRPAGNTNGVGESMKIDFASAC